jgi:malate dehydrogenase (oxaloacetate-decarboxylating)(NADP+)
MIRCEEALAYHADDRPGKAEVRTHKPCFGPREMRLAYLPGAVYPAQRIAADASQAYRYTARGNLVAVVTNGTAVPGLGDVGPEAAKPIQEGIGVMFKRLADIDVFDLEIDERDPDRFVETVRRLEPTFGGINIKDIRAPDGLAVYDRLREAVGIPLFHENLYSTAVVAAAALVNALDLAEKAIEDVRIVVCGAGTVGIGCARLLTEMGVRADHLALYDVNGLIHPDRGDLNFYQAAFARADAPRSLAEGLDGADVFLGASVGSVLTQEMIRRMARYPIVFATAMPEPEIRYADAKKARRDVIVATSSDTDPNAIVDLLSFPYIFRGALDVQASRISEGMMLAAASALAELAREEVVEEVSHAYGDGRFTFGPEYLLPKPIDPRILVRESSAVARAAIEEGLARSPVDEERYRESLTVRLGTGREVLRQLILKARRITPRVIFPEGANETIIRACAILQDEGIASPILLGEEAAVHRAAERLGVELSGVAVIDPHCSPGHEAYAAEYLELRGRRGVTKDLALRRVAEPRHFAALTLHRGDADMMICGITEHYADSLRTVLEVIGPAPGESRVSSCHLVFRSKEVIVLADCAVNIDPSAGELAEIALHAASFARSVGVEPRVAMLSFSNFGSADHPFARKVREATSRAREEDPELVIEGEIQLGTALDAALRARHFPFSVLPGPANVLVFPDLQSGSLALELLHKLGAGLAVGPLLVGTRLPAHIIQYGASVNDVVNLTAVAAVQAGAGGSGFSRALREEAVEAREGVRT